jgi:hypothetical protein
MTSDELEPVPFPPDRPSGQKEWVDWPEATKTHIRNLRYLHANIEKVVGATPEKTAENRKFIIDMTRYMRGAAKRGRPFQLTDGQSDKLGIVFAEYMTANPKEILMETAMEAHVNSLKTTAETSAADTLRIKLDLSLAEKNRCYFVDNTGTSVIYVSTDEPGIHCFSLLVKGKRRHAEVDDWGFDIKAPTREQLIFDPRYLEVPAAAATTPKANRKLVAPGTEFLQIKMWEGELVVISGVILNQKMSAATGKPRSSFHTAIDDSGWEMCKGLGAHRNRLDLDDRELVRSIKGRERAIESLELALVKLKAWAPHVRDVLPVALPPLNTEREGASKS